MECSAPEVSSRQSETHLPIFLDCGTQSPEQSQILVQRKEDLADVHLHFKNRPEPFSASVAEAVEAAALYFQLETGTFAASEYCSLLDIDGEEFVVRLSQVVLAEFRESVLAEGFQQLHGDTPEADDLAF